jgi:hypothetical protein
MKTKFIVEREAFFKKQDLTKSKKKKKKLRQYQTNLILKGEINKFNIIKKFLLKEVDLAKKKNPK